MALTTTPAFFDTGVFLNGLIEFDPDDPAQRLMDGLSRGKLVRPRTAWHCCLEFYSVATRLPEGMRLSPEEAGRLVEEEILGRCDPFDLPRALRLPFVRAASKERVTGGRIYDAHIAEVARQAGAKWVVTENRRHFTSLLRHGIRVLTTAEFVEDLRL
jgi:predicted nucleic acid-binding protein